MTAYQRSMCLNKQVQICAEWRHALVIVLFVATFSGCSRQIEIDTSGDSPSAELRVVSGDKPVIKQSAVPTFPFAITGEAWSGRWDGGGSPLSYRVVLVLENTSDSLVGLDQITGSFVPQSGKPLRITASDQEIELISIKSGEVRSFEFDTNGETYNLLRGAGNKPLTFSVTVQSQTFGLSTPFVAELPDIDRLFPKSKDGKGYPLRFSQ